MNPNKLAGSLKAAILVHAIGSEAARSLLDRLSDAERAMIYKLQSQMGSISPDLVERVAQEFLSNLGGPQLTHEPQAGRGEGSPSGSEPVAVEGGNGGDDPKQPTNLAAIQNIEASQLVQLIKDEHPQTIALIIVNLNPHSASEVLGQLPDEIKSDVAYRIASLDKVVSGMVEEIDKVFAEILQNKDNAATQEAGGVTHLAEILNQIDGASAEQIIDEIEESDPDLAEEIKANMFIFDDIIYVDDKGLQQVLRSVESNELALALKAAADEVKEKIFRNMSERAASILKEEMEVAGAVRMKDVTDAQQKVTKVIQDMERKGELIISGRGGEEFVA
ncbi:MAG: flagellar motor switch protein FliG [Desulfosarcinaceae bacterium]|nr:flagellar motor switch protein FliG [Desulfosarcinaceae bacterium]